MLTVLQSSSPKSSLDPRKSPPLKLQAIFLNPLSQLNSSLIAMAIANHPSLSSPSTSSFPPHLESLHRRPFLSPPLAVLARPSSEKADTSRLSICCQGRSTGPVSGPDGFGSEVSDSAVVPCSSPSSVIDFLTLCCRLKTTKRKGWINHGIKGPESIADHMYRMSLMALIAGDLPGLNRERCIKMAIVHDIAEAIVGDITPSDGIPKAEKSRREQAALNEMCEVLGGGIRADEIKELWTEYENNSSLEANLVKDFDKVEMILQAQEYEMEHGKDLDEFFQSTAGKFQTEMVKSWAAEIISRRRSNLAKVAN